METQANKVSRSRLEKFLAGTDDLTDDEVVEIVQELLDRRKASITHSHQPNERRFVRTREGQKEWVVDTAAMTYGVDLPGNMQLFVMSAGNVGGRPIGGWRWELRVGKEGARIPAVSGDTHTAAAARREAEMAYWKLINDQT